MHLQQAAERAHDIANALDIFRDYDFDHVHEISLSINHLNNLKIYLRQLNGLIELQGHRVRRNFAEDLDLLEHSITYTLQDVWAILGRMPEHTIGSDYRQTWKEISQYCHDMGRQTLPMRLDTYIHFASALCKILRKQAQDHYQVDNLRKDILDLRRLQVDDRRLIGAADAINELSLTPTPQPVMRQPRSYERQRENGRRPMSPIEPNDGWNGVRLPPLPSPPISPISPTTTYSSISQASSNEIETKHWATTILNDLPSTPLMNTKDQCECYGGYDVDGRNMPSRDYREILRVRFPHHFRTRFYVRESDYKAKMVCEWPEGRKRPAWGCAPLSELHVVRKGPILYLCRPCPGEGTSVAWAILKFQTIEWLVVFHCTFLSLRSHSLGRLGDNSVDRELKGEKRRFAGLINDNGYQHALRLYQDKHSNSLRLEAAIFEGVMKDTPIWTAFITHVVTSHTWCRQVKGSGIVYLRDLRRHIFSSQYVPQLAANGEHTLDFNIPSDALDFVDIINEFAEEYRRPPPLTT